MRIPFVHVRFAAMCLAASGAAHAKVEVGSFHNPGDEDDNFGETVAQSGDIVIIGAGTGDNAAGLPSGAVYVYDIRNPDEVLRTLSPSDGVAGDFFGSAIAIQGENVVVGSPGHSPNGVSSAGAVYVYDVTTGQEKKLVPDDLLEAAGEGFGTSVAISGNTIVIGVPLDDVSNVPTNDNEGSVYVFDLLTCNQIDRIHAPNTAPGDRFGTSVGVAGGTIIVGTPGHDGNHGGVHTFDAVSLEHTNTIVSDSPQSFSGFGNAVALGQFSTALIGSPFADDEDDTGAGVVCGSNVETQASLYTFGEGTGGDEVGKAVGVDGSTSRGGAPLAVIGAPGDDDEASGAGAAYVINASTGDIITKLTASDAQLFDLFGSAVSISGAHVVVGAPNEDTNGSNSGAAYLFRLDLPCNDADLTQPFGLLDFDDVLAFLVAFGEMDPLADLAPAFGTLDFDDVLAFLVSFAEGCP